MTDPFSIVPERKPAVKTAGLTAVAIAAIVACVALFGVWFLWGRKN